jgi:CSLREA domain-containing protein
MALIITLNAARVSQAANTTLTVTTLLDVINPNNSKCSLREAMQRAFDNAINNSLPNDCPQSKDGFTTIKFAVPGTFTGNTADKNGGAIALKGGRLEIVDSTFTGNVVKGTLLPSACACRCCGSKRSA